MENPWTEFQNNPKQDYLILEADKLVVDKFNETANEKFRIHTEIMPAPFMGNVLEAQVLLLLLNPGFDEEEERKNQTPPRLQRGVYGYLFITKRYVILR